MRLRRAALWMSATGWRQFVVQWSVGYCLYMLLIYVMNAVVWYALLAMAAVQVTMIIVTPSVAKVAKLRAELDTKLEVDE